MINERICRLIVDHFVLNYDKQKNVTFCFLCSWVSKVKS